MSDVRYLHVRPIFDRRIFERRAVFVTSKGPVFAKVYPKFCPVVPVFKSLGRSVP